MKGVCPSKTNKLCDACPQKVCVVWVFISTDFRVLGPAGLHRVQAFGLVGLLGLRVWGPVLLVAWLQQPPVHSLGVSKRGARISLPHGLHEKRMYMSSPYTIPVFAYVLVWGPKGLQSLEPVTSDRPGIFPTPPSSGRPPASDGLWV